MLSIIANPEKSAQNCQKPSKFEIPPNVEILVFFFKKKFQHVEKAPKHMPTVWIFITRISCMPFLLSNSNLCM
jgi:hypothetical protein